MSTQLLVSAVGAAVGFVATSGNPAGAKYGWFIGSCTGSPAHQNDYTLSMRTSPTLAELLETQNHDHP